MARNPRSSRRKSLRTSALPLLRLEEQRGADCGIACIASLVGAKYEDVLAEASRREPIGVYMHDIGLYTSDVIKIAKRFGCNLREKRKCNFETDCGILAVAWNRKKGSHTHHYVIVVGGLIFDLTDLSVWNAKEYESANCVKFGSILVPV